MTVPRRIETERLLLREWREGDVDAVFRRGSQAAFGRYILAIPWPYAREDADAFVGMVLERQERPNEWWWAIAVRPGDESVGDVNATFDELTGVVTLGWGIAPEYWRRGLMTEAVRAVIDLVFEGTGAFEVRATADAENVGSWRVMEKTGMQREALVRGERLHRGERRDEVRYGLLRPEWERGRVSA